MSPNTTGEKLQWQDGDHNCGNSEVSLRVIPDLMSHQNNDSLGEMSNMLGNIGNLFAECM